MRAILLFLIAQVFVLVSFAQHRPGKINGAIKSADGKFLDAVTVSLFKSPDSTLVKIAVTDKQGQFEFENIAEGKYRVAVTHVGFATWLSVQIEISSSQTQVHLTDISLQPSTSSLGEVTVVGKRPLIENKIDKTVVNVDASISNAGNSAMEVLEKSPNISIDKDGNINLKGKQGVIILIDGKQTYLGGQDLIDYLKNLPANQLDQIEIMTQPSAKYDASGNAGIINIKTKRGQQKGFNGSVTLSYVQAVYPKSPNSFNFNYRDVKFNVYGNYSFAYWQGFNDIVINRYFEDPAKGLNTHFNQTSKLGFNAHPFNWKTGIDFFANPTTTIGIAVSGQLDRRKSTAKTTSFFYDLEQGGALGSINKAMTTNDNPWKNYGYNLNFRKQFDKKGKELTADFDYMIYDTKTVQKSDNYTYNPDGSIDSTTGTINPYLLRGNLPSTIKILTGKADYTHPLKNNAKLEAGWKSSYVKTDNNAEYSYLVNDIPQADTTRSNHFLYEENINAAYVNYSKQIKKWGIQAGLRVEQTHAKGNQVVKNQKFDTNYVQLFPTVFVSYAMTDKNQFTLSFGRRIDRPNYQDMNPFQYFLDQYTYRQGNPYLRPQFSYNVELSYNYKGELNISANYTHVSDVINDILKQNDSTKVTYQTKENVSQQTNIGLSVSYNKQLAKWWSVSLSGNVYNDHYSGIVNDTNLNIDATAFLVNMSTQFTFGKGWGAEISGFYNSKTLYSGLIVSQPMEIVSFGFSKQVLKNKGSLKLNIRDPFYIMHFNGYTKFSNINFNVNSHWDNRRVGLTFTYRFGKKLNNIPQRRKGDSDEEKRVGGASPQQ